MSEDYKWQWFGWGKHPGVSDFISTGEQTPLFKRFTQWVENGFYQIMKEPELKLRSRHCSWRFWTHGTGEDIVCGLVRNSCDSYGRSFPLLYLGRGELSDWQQHSFLLPFAFEPVWKNFEYIGSARYRSLEQLNEALYLTRTPNPYWEQYTERMKKWELKPSGIEFNEKDSEKARFIRYKCRFPEELPFEPIFCHQVTPAENKQTSKAVFIGEVRGEIATAVVENTLTPSDFKWLWSLSEKITGDNK